MTSEARVGTRAPVFSWWVTTGPALQRRQVNQADYLDRWLVLLFYPHDFSLI